MTDGDKPRGQMEKRIGDAYTQLPEIQKSRKRLRIMGWAQILIPVIILVVGIWSLYSTARGNLVDRKEELVTHIQERWGSVWPRLEREAQTAAERVVPKLEEELAKAQDKVATTLPAVMERESKELNAKLEARTRKRIKEALDKVAKEQRQKMEEVFGDYIKCKPEDTQDVCNEKKAAFDELMTEIQRSYEEWAIQEMTTTFARHMTAIENIRTTMTKFAGTPGGTGGAGGTAARSGAAPGEMIMLFLELVTESMGGTSDLFEPPAEPAASDNSGTDAK